MDLILLIIILAVVFVIVLLWVKTDELTRRQDRAAERAVLLDACLLRQALLVRPWLDQPE